jgi:hypothetical protein
MAAGAFTVVNSWMERIGNAELNMDTDAFVARLYASTSNLSTTSDDASAVTNELGTANGYTAGGYSVTPTWSRSVGTVTFDTTDATWTASGAGITARWCAIVDTTTTPDRVVAFCLLDSTPADVTTTAGNVLTVQIHTSGVFTMARA